MDLRVRSVSQSYSLSNNCFCFSPSILILTATEVVALVTGVVGCLTSVVSATPQLHRPLGECYGYVSERIKYTCYGFRNSYVEEIERMICELRNNLRRLEYLIDFARSTGSSEVAWLDNALHTIDKIQGTSRDILSGMEPSFHLCRMISSSFISINCIPNYYARGLMMYRINDNLRITRSLIDDFKAEGEMPSRRGSVGVRMKFLEEILVGVQVEDLLKIERLIFSRGNQVIGVSGAIVKTEVVAQLYQKLQDSKSFDTYIWVEASYEDDLKKLQMNIASKIGLSLSNDDAVLENAALLSSALMKKGKCLLVLEDLWKAFSLEKIGFPTEDIGYKVIITSRYSSVCSQMASEETIKLKLLSDEEVNQLLRREMGISTFPEEIELILKDVAKECGGLPLTVVMVARHLRKLNWDDHVTVERVLKKKLGAFRKSTAILKYMEDKVVEKLMISYDQLKHSNYSYIQECVLCCTMYPRNHTFVAKELMEYWIWEGLLGEVDLIDKKLEEAEEILDELKDASLLESIGHENGFEIVKMHPLIWDIAVRKAKQSSSFFTKPGQELRKPLYKDWPEDVERVSLMRNNLNILLPGPNFCNLSTLLLQYNPIETLLHEDFFNSFPNLKILDLSNTGLGKQPVNFLSRLKNLTALLLRHCWSLTSLPSLSELVALLTLDVSGSPITELPCGLENLTELMRLDLSNTRVSSMPRGLLPQLYNLQELMMIGCDFLWLSQSLMQDASAASIEDIQKLQHLSVLEINLANTCFLHDYIISGHWRQLKCFKFCVGGLYNRKLGNNSLVFMREFPIDPTWLPNNTSQLLVMLCGDVTHLTMPIFRHLKTLDVSYCAKLKYLFKIEVLQSLQNLEEMVIAECPEMDKVIEQDGGVSTSSGTIILPSLKKLTLFNLSQLCLMSDCILECPSMQTIEVWSCSKLTTFPVLLSVSDDGYELITPEGFKEIRGQRSWLENLQQCPANEEKFLQTHFIEESPPKELISRAGMVLPQDMASGS